MATLPPIATRVLNFLLYQIGWFSCVLGAATGHPLAGALGALLLAGVHLLLARQRRAEALLMVAAGITGVTVDSLQQHLGVFTFRGSPFWILPLPFWVFVIWAQFATLLRYALHWLAGRYLLAALLGSIGGPLAYFAGIRLGAALPGSNLLFSSLSLAVVWGGATPTLVWLAGRLGAGEGEYRGWGGA